MNLITKNREYYREMLIRNRLMTFRKDGRLVCLFTFYIGSKQDENKYIRDNMWEVLTDDKNGDTCFIDQLLTDRNPDNPRLSYEIWHRFKAYIKENFKNVKHIRWNRYKKFWKAPMQRRTNVYY